VILCQPRSNPCGRVFVRAELETIAGLAEEVDAFDHHLTRSNEHIVYAPHRHTYFARCQDGRRTISWRITVQDLFDHGAGVWATSLLRGVNSGCAQARTDFLTWARGALQEAAAGRPEPA